jgi:hypothetical protein
MPVLWEYHDLETNSHIVNHTGQASGKATQDLGVQRRVQVCDRSVDCEVDDLPDQDGRVLSKDEQMLGR